MATNNELLNIVLGTPGPFFGETLDLKFGQKFLDVFRKYGFFDIDTARGYAEAEKYFGELKAAEQGFTIDTKVVSFAPGAHKPDSIRASIVQSFDLLKVNKVHILYLHSPDRTVPFEETLRVMDEEYKKGKFEKLGISNYTAAELSEIVSICDKNGFVRPTVYQGNYSLLVRKGEGELFPLLKKEKIAFYAWSPLGGGFLTGKNLTKEALIANTERFKHEKFANMYLNFFAKESIFAQVNELNEFVKGFNLCTTETALRWLAFHSQLSKADGDAIILGASKPEQFENNLVELQKGPLPLPVVEFIDKLWGIIKDDSPAYHF